MPGSSSNPAGVVSFLAYAVALLGAAAIVLASIAWAFERRLISKPARLTLNRDALLILRAKALGLSLGTFQWAPLVFPLWVLLISGRD